MLSFQRPFFLIFGRIKYLRQHIEVILSACFIGENCPPHQSNHIRHIHKIVCQKFIMMGVPLKKRQSNKKTLHHIKTTLKSRGL